MNKFLFKSTDADLQKIYQYLERMSGNILYITHQVDFIRKRILAMETDKSLQSQVSDYFEDTIHIPEEASTSVDLD